MNATQKTIIVAALLVAVLAGYWMGGELRGDGNAAAEYRAIGERLGQIDRDLKSEFRGLNQTIDRGRKETGDTRIIVEGVRGSLEKDRATLGELQDSSGKLKAAIREVRNQKQEAEAGKRNP